DLVLPGIGLTFWMVLVFGILVFLLSKFAWKPILKALSERENSIDEALKSAEEAKLQMAQLQSDNEVLLKKAREERELILKEARTMKESIISEAKRTAEEEGKRMIQKASDEINKQKESAINELKTQVAGLSVEIAEKLIDRQLSGNDEQQKIIEDMVSGMNIKLQAKA